MRFVFISVLVVFVTVFFAACDDMPRDQEDTFKHIKGTGRMRVGLIENPPWIVRTQGEPAGVEVELIRQFAAECGAQAEWQWGGEEKLLGALEKYELDLVAGGFSDSTPWSERVGLTSQYYEEKFDIGVPAGSPSVSELTGREIAVDGDSRLSGLLREKNAVPIERHEAGDIPVAGPEWKLASLGRTPSGTELHADRHVIATPPGENNLVKRLDKFLSERKEQIPALLQQQQTEEASR